MVLPYMNKKRIIILTGLASAKKEFVNIAKEDGCWIWNINPYEYMMSLSNQLGVSVSYIAERIPDFRSLYVLETARRFSKDPSANLLVLHGVSQLLGRTLSSLMRDDVEILGIHIQNDKEDDKNGIDAEIVLKYGESFKLNVNSILA
jgi:hypothetical protein